MHGVHHQLQGGINNRSRFFGIESFNQRRRAFEIGKQGGDRLALAVCSATGFQRRLLGADALGQMGRRVGDWGLGCWVLGVGAKLLVLHLSVLRFAILRRPPRPALPHSYPWPPARFDQFVLDIGQQLVIKVKLALERTIRDPPLALEQHSGLFYYLRKLHRSFSLFAAERHNP